MVDIKSSNNNEMLVQVPKQKSVIASQIKLNDHTSFQVHFDVYLEEYFYILLQEKTANSPFYYHNSYTLEELQSKHDIFLTCKTLQKVKERFTELFKNKKVKLISKENGKIIEILMEAKLFCETCILKFELNREIVAIEKDKKILELYDITKKKLNKLNEIVRYLNKNKKNNNRIRKIINELSRIINEYDIPGMEIIDSV